ncbi:alcohol dehydrogenase catalytic domain-containing protein [Fodinicola feengrottensis]|uniref:alcohol dehydrogenase catalytic domain-containing protein n=1 Tax=Fodinicola feengrottensis TaxID=435914 RepID=UPI0028BDA9F6|nr:alcohol dehydrogenase catalytic domain-containing protein [Fodinicola feengrottensis]
MLELIETARPEPGLAEVLVRVHATSVNPTDWKSRMAGGGITGEPPILGYDVSGVVEVAGPGVTLFQPGDEIFGMPRFPQQASTYAEYVTAPARHFTRKPASLDHLHAAALRSRWPDRVAGVDRDGGRTSRPTSADPCRRRRRRSSGRTDRQSPRRLCHRHGQ